MTAGLLDETGSHHWCMAWHAVRIVYATKRGILWTLTAQVYAQMRWMASSTSLEETIVASSNSLA